MRVHHLRRATLVVLYLAFLATQPALAQSERPRLGIGVKVSTLGIGIEAATSVLHNSNVRGAFNVYNYSRDFNSDGIHYAGNLKFRSVQVLYDQYIVGGFHISPGLLLHNGNHARAAASVPGGQTFTLGGFPFSSQATDPVRGTARVDFRNVAPMILAGFGNLLPRSERRFGVNVDVGVAFQGPPNVTLNLAGTACVPSTTNCVNAATDPLLQNQLRAERQDIASDLDRLRYYPVASVGVSWKF